MLPVRQCRQGKWEVGALEPDELQRLVLAVVDPYVDREIFAEQNAREEKATPHPDRYLGRWARVCTVFGSGP
ncbi:hypothetical protein OHT57_46655 [Streptomyces sp. NBC_00285]|uniref:hypothetical protein n=1 Tax=Streptomyces sp. NBC_00285 TaxID=2975700 RepID=UPI002E29512D|nr:hypothetical protein [Streptomyces sp. NBC_00285]